MKIQMIMAHPDDEVIFGWPILQQFGSFINEIVFVADDSNNPDRAWCSHRLDAAKELGCELGYKVRGLGYNSEFYRLPTRDMQLKELTERIASVVDPEAFVFTHNPWGEYGHLDHIITHLAVASKADRLLYSSIQLNSNWIRFGQGFDDPNLVLGHYMNEERLYLSHKLFYDRLGVWTWNQLPVKECDVYKFPL